MDPLSIKIDFSEKDIIDLKKAELAVLSVLREKAEIHLLLRETILRMQDHYYYHVGIMYLDNDHTEEKLSSIILDRHREESRFVKRMEYAQKVLANTREQLETFASLRGYDYDYLFDLDKTDVKSLSRAPIGTEIMGNPPCSPVIGELYNAVDGIPLPGDNPLASPLADKEKITEVITDWASGNTPEQIRGLAGDVIRSIQIIAALKDKIDAIGKETESLRKSELYTLFKVGEHDRTRERDQFVILLRTIARKVRQKNDWIKKLNENPELKGEPFTVIVGNEESMGFVERGARDLAGYREVCKKMDAIKHGTNREERAEACDNLLILCPVGESLHREELEGMLYSEDRWNRMFASFILSKSGLYRNDLIVNLVAFLQFGIEAKKYRWVTFTLDPLCEYDVRKFRSIRTQVIPTFQDAIASDAPLLSYDELKKAREDAFEDEYYTPARDHICNNYNFKRVMINKLVDWGQYAKEAIDAALASLANPDEIVRAEVVLAFHEAAEKGKFPGAYADDIIKALLTMVHDESEMVRAFLAGTLGKICTATPEVIEALQALSDDAFATVTKYARESLALLEGKNEQQ